MFTGTTRKSENRNQLAASFKGDGDAPNLNQTIDAYANQRIVIQNTIFKSKMDYYSNLILEAGNDNKALFHLIDHLLHGKAEKSFPTSTSAEDLANTFVTFFEDKITHIKSIPTPSEISDFFSSLDISTTNCELSNFSPTSNLELSKIARSVVQKCCLDLLPATLLKKRFDLPLPSIYSIVNLSLVSGLLPSCLNASSQETEPGPWSS